MNQNRRGNHNRQQNRPRNRPPSNRSTPQQDNLNQPPTSQQFSQTNSPLRRPPQATSGTPSPSTSCVLSHQQRLHNPYSKSYHEHNQPTAAVGTVDTSHKQWQQTQSDDTTQFQRFQPQNFAPPQVMEPQNVQYVPSALDREADNLYSDVHYSLTRAIDASYAIPISEHVFYSSFDSYGNIMIEQQRQLNEMMGQLTECSEIPSSQPFYVQSAPLAAPQNYHRRIDFDKIEDLQDKYESIHDFSEQMYDRIGHNLDDAEGLISRDAQLVKATLEAANRNKLVPTIATTTTAINPNTPYYHNQHQQVMQQTNLSSSSSSSSLVTRPSGTSSPASFSNQQQQTLLNDAQQTRPVRGNDGQIYRGPSNMIQPINLQNPNQRKNPYLTKQYNPTYYNRFLARENKNIPRPQDSFKDEIDNSYAPFKPILKDKPNAVVPLKVTLERVDEHSNQCYSHPYETEINCFSLDESVLTYREPIVPTDIETAPIVLVETVDQLESMCRIIEQEKEIAVDVEHHSYRSYQGITCLLQISIRAQDFVVDALKLRGELYRLNKSFTDPKIVKVFHGADCDILWLQRDFGVYVVNLFDTSRAAKLMKFAHLSLAFLIKHYCGGMEIDKSYQLADWRERPLPLPMLQYARADTHYLLYIYDRLRNDLLTRNKSDELVGKELLKNVFYRCNEICLKRYEKPPYSDKSHLSVLRRSKSTFNAKQMYAFKEMYKWRDRISRELDESVGYVLPNNLMIRIAEYLPREPQGITALCNPVPPTLKKYLNEIHAIILRALEQPLDETSKVMGGRYSLDVDPKLRSIDLDSVNHKQDIAHTGGLQEGEVHGILDMLYQLNCDDPSSEQQNNSGRHLLSNQQYENQQNIIDYTNYMNSLNHNPSRLYNFLSPAPVHQSHREEIVNVHQSIQKQFVSPYRRYEARNK